MSHISLHVEPDNENTMSLVPDRDDPLGESPDPNGEPPTPEGIIHDNLSGGKYLSTYKNGFKNADAANIYLEQVYFDQHGHFPTHAGLRALKLRRFNILRKYRFAMEKIDALIIGDDPLVSLCTAYSLAKQSNFRVLIVPGANRLPEGDTEEVQHCRVRDLYREDMMGNLIRDYLGFSESTDFSDYDAALFTLTHACQSLNDGRSRVMLSDQYLISTDRRDSYQLQDPMDENLTHQLFYAYPCNNLTGSLFKGDWELIRKEMMVHSLPPDAYKSDRYITEIITKLVYVTSPLPLDMEGNIMCQHYRIASGLQSVSQVTQHTDFGYQQRMLDVMSGVGADLFIKEQVTAQDYIQKYIQV